MFACVLGCKAKRCTTPPDRFDLKEDRFAPFSVVAVCVRIRGQNEKEMKTIGLFRSTSGYTNLLGFNVVLFLMYYSVECQTKSLNNPCVRFTMSPIFLAILKFFTIQILSYLYMYF